MAISCSALVVLLLVGNGAAADSPPAPAAAAADGRMDWWREARFGLFIHWGLYAVPAGEWQGATEHGEWIMHTAQIPVDRYERFREQFNPVGFDADAWVALAKRAGMKYIVITSKHHDGFCLFDSKLTDYDIMSTPFQRDIMKELSQACRKAGLKMCWYHSIMDWHHPDYLPRRDWEKRSAEGASFARYLTHLKGQVKELLTSYGDIGVMWFDGEWESTWTHEAGKDLYAWCRQIQPNVIVNNRVDTGRAGMAGMSEGADRAGDFGTPEQEIPETGLPGVDWETCMTMNDHWGYNRHDQHWKSAPDMVHMLVDIASKGGNFLLNVGPTAEGKIPPASVERLEAMGRWMDKNADAVRGTRANPGLNLAWGRCTMRPMGDTTRLYLHVFAWPDGGGKLVVPGLGNEVTRAWLLAHEQESLEHRRVESDLEVQVPPAAPDPVCSVVVLDVRGAPIVYHPPAIDAPANILVRPITVRLNGSSPALIVRYTLDGSTPVAGSPAYTSPLQIADTTVLKARTFEGERPVSQVVEAKFAKVTPRPAVTPPAALEPGLSCEVFAGAFDRLPDFDQLEAAQSLVVSNLTLSDGPRERVGRRFRGYLKVPADDVYAFALTSDDGSRLEIDHEVVIDHDGLHVSEERRGTIALAAGLHPITVEYFNKTGGAELKLAWAPVGEKLAPLADGSLTHEAKPGGR